MRLFLSNEQTARGACRKSLQALHRKAAAEQFISEFVKYVQTEAKLPRALNGWTLKFNDDGKPFLIGGCVANKASGTN